MRGLLLTKFRYFYSTKNFYSTKSYSNNAVSEFDNEKFETVFSLPTIKYISLINRLKIYHVFGSSAIVPFCGVLETMNVVSENIFLPAVYIGLTGAAVLSIASIPFRNVIGFLYVNEDDSKVKVSYVDFWGRRKDEIINTDDLIPLYESPPRLFDAIYLTPKLKNGKEFKLLLLFGKVYNAKKMNEVLE